MSAPSSTSVQFDAVARTLQNYVEGARLGRDAQLKSAFHEGATIYGYIGPELFGGPIQTFYDWHAKNGPATDLESRIVSIDVAGSIATARMELLNWTGHRFTDMFTLLKIDGAWKITSKMFFLHE